MNCPYCGKEMAQGYIPNAAQPVQWIPNGGKPSKMSFSTSATGVSLNNDFSLLSLVCYKAEAYYCKECSVVIAPIGTGSK